MSTDAVGEDGLPLVPEVIDCIDCGGRAHRITYPRLPTPPATPAEAAAPPPYPLGDGLWEPGEVVAYRCEDCLDRWDLVVPGAEDEDADT